MHLIALIALAACTSGDATWRYDTAPPVETEEDTGEEEEEEEDYAKVLWGDYEADEGWTGFWLYDPGQGGELCDMEYEIVAYEETTLCKGCEEAWLIERGELEVWVNEGGACDDEGWTDLEGTRFGIGYEGETMWADLGEGWVEVEAEGEVWDEGFWFDIWLGD